MSTMRVKNKDGTWDKVPVLGSYQAVLAANEAATNAQNAANTAEKIASDLGLVDEAVQTAVASAEQASNSATTASEKADVATAKANEAAVSASLAREKASISTTSASSAIQAKNTAIETLRATQLIANSGNADQLSTTNAADIIELKENLTGAIGYDLNYMLTWINGEYVSNSGEIISYDSWKRTDYIEIFSNDKSIALYGIKEAAGYNCFYDANKQFISFFYNNDGIVTVPNNAKYFILSCKATDDVKAKKEIVSIYKTKADLDTLAGDIQKAFTGETTITKDTRAIVTTNNDLATLRVKNVSLFSADEPIYLEDTAYNYNGLNLIFGTLPANIGLVFGKDDVGNYYFLDCNTNQISRIFKVTPTGTYTRLIDVSGGAGSDFTSVTINSFDNGILNYSIYTNNGRFADLSCNLASYNINNKLIGFIPYNTNEYIFSLKIIPYTFKVFIEEKAFEESNKVFKIAKVLTNGGKIKLIGDSITAGFGGSNFNATASGGGKLIYGTTYQNLMGHCWANSFKTYIESKYTNVKVENYGVSGANSDDLTNHLTELISNDDDLIICMVGTNNRWATNPVSRLYNGLDSIYTYCKKLNIPVIFMANIPCSVERETTEGGVTYTMHMEDVEQTIMRFCSLHKMDFVNVYKMFMDYCKYTNTTIDSYLVDRLHPNDNGYNVMFYLISNDLGVATKRDGATW